MVIKTRTCESEMKKRVLITGSGQIGSYACERWLQEGFDVWCLIKYRSTDREVKNLKNIINDIKIIEGDITDCSFLNKQFFLIKPHLIINTSAQSHVGHSFSASIQTIETTGTSVLYMLEAIRNSCFNSKFLTLSTSELFGNSAEEFQNEKTPFAPASPYAAAKNLAHNLVKIYRESYNMWCAAPVLFNTESPRRGTEFVTKKIVKQACEIKNNKRQFIELGNIESRRDWQSVHDAVEGIWLQSNHNEPDEFVFGSGKTYSIKEFVQKTFDYLQIPNWENFIKINPLYLRPNDVNYLCADASKAKKVLGWNPKYNLDDIIKEMVDYEIKNQTKI